MADAIVYGEDFHTLARRYKDMGDGTYAEVVSGAGGSSSSKPQLRYAPPPQDPDNTIVVLVPAAGGTFGTSGTPLYSSTQDVIFVLPMATGSVVATPMTGALRWFGGRHVRIIGGVCQPTSGIGNYVIVGQQVAGSCFIEGVEFPDQSAAQPDVIDVCGDWSSSTQGFAPDIYLQNIRCLKIRGTNATNHADFFQPQGVIGHLYVDKLTVTTNYDVFTIATDSCNNVPPKGVFFSRVNSWWDAANGTNPFTAHYWINSVSGTVNQDTAPFPIVFEDVYADSDRATGSGGGRVQFADSAVYPNTGVTAGGGTLLNGAIPGPFTAGEAIGAVRGGVVAHGQGFASFADPKMMVDGVVYNQSPALGRTDVVTDTDGLASFVPTGIGTSYVSPGYILTPGVDFAG